MNILYLLIIKPIEAVLGFLFRSYVSLTGSYGISIILLSLSVTIIMFPLFYIAEVWKRKEQAVEKRMKKRLSYIKRYYTGQKRYCMIKATHRLEGYTAASSFRTSFGLLIQIPFFFAAYHLLSHYEPYRGVGWLFIRDFAVPDGLLWGLNLLPIAMTVINIVSSSIYMKGSRAKDIVELYVMAGVFLLLLYASPAALVLYWTMNNVFSVGKSLIFLRLFPHEKYVPDSEDKCFKDYVQGFGDAVKPCLTADFYLFAAMTVLFAAQCRILKFCKDYFVYIYAFTALLATGSVLVLFVVSLRSRYQKPCRSVIIKTIVSGFIFILLPAVGFYLKCQGAEGTLLKKILFISAIAADILLYVCAKNILEFVAPKDEIIIKSAGERAWLFGWCSCFLGLSATIIWPLWVYFSAPAETGVRLVSILSANIPAFVVWALISFLAFLFSGETGRSKLAEALAFLSILAVCYHFVLPNNYGELDRTLLHFADKLDDKSLLLFTGDIVVIIGIFLLTKILVQKYTSICRNVIAVILCCMVGITGIKVKNYLISDISRFDKGIEDVWLPENNDAVNGYTRTGKNIVLLLSDMFTGGYLDTVFEECPEYKEKLSGFTWYRNAVSPSWQTVCSMPSIFAGDDYLPLALDEMSGTGFEKIEKSARQMLEPFKKENYSIAVVDGDAANLSPALLSTVESADSEDYGNVWQKKYYKEEGSEAVIKQGHLFIMLSLFQNSPYFLKPIIYNESNWFIFSRKALFWAVEKHVFPNYGYMRLLSEVSNAEMKQNTFKYIHNSLTHSPFGINDDGSLTKPGQFPDEEHKTFYSGRGAYNTQKEFLALFDKWCDWLKENKIYDNTYIILLSDHGNVYADYNPLTDDKIINGFNPLFMVKGFGSDGPVQIDSETLVVSSDAEKFIKNALDGTPVDIPKDRTVQVVYYDNSDKFLDTGKIDIIHAYDVKGWVFDPENWKEIK